MPSPNVMASLRRNWWPEIVVAIGLMIAPWILPHVGFNANLMSRVLVWGLFGLGFDLLFGFTGLLSFGQAAFYGAGGFVCAYLLTNGVIDSVVLALFIGMIAASVCGAVIGSLAIRRTGVYFAMITLAFGEMAYFLDISPLSPWTGGENGLPGVPLPTLNFGFFTYHVNVGWPMYGFTAVIFWLGFLVARRIVHSPVGTILVSIRENTQRSLALGHRVRNYKLAVFMIAAAYGGLAGGLLGVLQTYMPPEAFALHTSAQLIMQTVIGGAGTLIGPLIGAAVWLWLRGVLQYIPDIGAGWKLILGIVFVVLVTVLRRGICGEIMHRFRHRPLLRKHTLENAGERAIKEETRRRPDGGGRLAPAPAPAPAGAQARLSAHPVADIPIAHSHTRQLEAKRDTPALESRALTKHYGGVHAVDGVSITVAQGELRALIGPNGAGKTTLFNMLAGEITPSSGDVFLHGERVTRHGVTTICQLGLSKSYQINQIFNRLTVRENLLIPILARVRGPFRLDMLRSVHQVKGVGEQTRHVLELVGLDERAELPASMLDYGEKRRLEIGLALATAPTTLLLDEPLAGLSSPERSEIIALFKRLRKGRTLVIVEHDMDAVLELADYISVLQEGKLLAEGTPAEIQSNQAVQEAYLGGIDDNESA